MIYSAKNKACLYRLSDPQRVLSSISQARLVEKDLVAVPADLFNMQLARLCGLPAISPIITEYDWPTLPGRTPFRHQTIMASFHTLHPRSINTSEMGTAKTLSVLWAADYLMRQGVIKRALVVAPLSTLERVWCNEIYQNFLERRSVGLLYGDRSRRLAVLEEPTISTFATMTAWAWVPTVDDVSSTMDRLLSALSLEKTSVSWSSMKRARTRTVSPKGHA
jgi:SNF2 family DNA or RNA helicase